jgi:cytoskeletal protein RodZ
MDTRPTNNTNSSSSNNNDMFLAPCLIPTNRLLSLSSMINVPALSSICAVAWNSHAAVTFQDQQQEDEDVLSSSSSSSSEKNNNKAASTDNKHHHKNHHHQSCSDACSGMLACVDLSGNLRAFDLGRNDELNIGLT